MSDRVSPRTLWLALSAAVLVLAGCPYSSEHPIGSPADAVRDNSLLGTWEATQENEKLTIKIQGRGAAGYLITAEGAGEEETADFEAYVTAVDGQKFLNLRETPGSPGEEWYYANYRSEDGRLLLRLVDDALFESRSFASSEELRAFIRANLKDPRLYGSEPDPGQDWDWEFRRTLPEA